MYRYNQFSLVLFALIKGNSSKIEELKEIGLKTLVYRHSLKEYTKNFQKCFVAEPNKFTERQKGLAWCWIACFQGLFKYHGINLSQEYISKKIFKTDPEYFEIQRNKSLHCINCDMIKDVSDAINYISAK